MTSFVINSPLSHLHIYLMNEEVVKWDIWMKFIIVLYYFQILANEEMW